MTTNDRINVFTDLFQKLQATSSRTLKEAHINKFLSTYPECEEDLQVIFETLDGKRPIGWTFVPSSAKSTLPPISTIASLIYQCQRRPNLVASMTYAIERLIGEYGAFLAPIVNRTLRLGVMRKTRDLTSPMLAKKFTPALFIAKPLTILVVTEKLDGNRCIARYDKTREEWTFTSRSGKPLTVSFTMRGLPTSYIYDGEIMSLEQTLWSERRHLAIANDETLTERPASPSSLFNETSGLINSKSISTNLVYNIFDIITDDTYEQRRKKLEEIDFATSPDVRRLPTLYTGTDITHIDHLLDRVVDMGGEGLMLNTYDGLYVHKRTDQLMKYKRTQMIDMRVTAVKEGTGKYEQQVGAITVTITTNDNKEITCDVGSGLTDEQRYMWWVNPTLIVNKIVQIGYHELTQDKSLVGSNIYSLRFPRLIRVRYQKDETSEY